MTARASSLVSGRWRAPHVLTSLRNPAFQFHSPLFSRQLAPPAAVEAAVKLVGLRWVGWNPKGYFEDDSGFDLFIALVGVVDLLLPLFAQCSTSSLLELIRALRCFRVLRLIASFKQARMVINAGVVSFSQLSNVCILLVLLMFVYAILGMAIFHAERRDLFHDGINLYANFESTYGACLRSRVLTVVLSTQPHLNVIHVRFWTLLRTVHPRSGAMQLMFIVSTGDAVGEGGGSGMPPSLRIGRHP